MADIKNMAPRSGRILNEQSQVRNEADGINEDGSRDTNVTGSNIALPIDLQFVRNEPISWLTVKSVATNAWDMTGQYEDVKNFSSVEVKVKLGTSKAYSLDLYWSEDGTNIDLVDSVVVNKTTQFDTISTKVKGSLLKAVPRNLDAASNTFTVTGLKKVL